MSRWPLLAEKVDVLLERHSILWSQCGFLALYFTLCGNIKKFSASTMSVLQLFIIIDFIQTVCGVCRPIQERRQLLPVHAGPGGAGRHRQQGALGLQTWSCVFWLPRCLH